MGLIESLDTFHSSDRTRLEVDHAGQPAKWDVPADAPDVVVIVGPANEALKRVTMGQVRDSLDREDLWEVAGVSVVRRIAETRPSDVDDVAGWIDHLRMTDAEIGVIERSDAP